MVSSKWKEREEYSLKSYELEFTQIPTRSILTSYKWHLVTTHEQVTELWRGSAVSLDISKTEAIFSLTQVQE